MAVNDTRSMNAEFSQGGVDNTYIQLTPNRGCVENPPLERIGQPQFRNVDRWIDHSHIEASFQHSLRPVEYKTGAAAAASDPRF